MTTNEKASAQAHFIDLCRLLGEPTPHEADPTGQSYAFEKQARKPDGSPGYADAWKRGFFGWEYKGKKKDLKAAYVQLLGYRDAMQPFCEGTEDLEIEGDFSEESGYRAGDAILRMHPRPTAVFCANDGMAVGLLAALQEAGLRVPEDIAVTGFDDIYVSALPWIDLTTLNPHSRELGKRTAEALLARIDKTANGPADVVLPPTLVERGTTAPPR